MFLKQMRRKLNVASTPFMSCFCKEKDGDPSFNSLQQSGGSQQDRRTFTQQERGF